MGRAKGSRNARRIDPATRTTIGVRCTKAEREAYEAAARAAGMPVSAWIRQALRDAAKSGAAHAAAFAAWIDGGKPSSGALMVALERASTALVETMNRTAARALAPSAANR